MRYLNLLLPTLLATSTFLGYALAARKSANSVLLSSVKALTLQKDARTSHRRVAAIPQLRCVGGSARGLYDVEAMRCTNQGADYDDENIQWTCTASLPAQFKLGSTDVICEGYSSPADPYILKGSCGVEYRLSLTPEGVAEFGSGSSSDMWKDFKPRGQVDWMGVVFWTVFLAVLGWMIYSIFFSPTRRLDRGAGGNNQPWGWGGGGGGDDPPPPYDAHQPKKPSARTNTRRSAPGTSAPRGQQEGWRPGLWTGLLGGAAAGYLAGNRGGRTQEQQQAPRRGFWGGNDNGGEGSSRWGGGRSGSNYGGGSGSGSSSFASSSRHESTGFGGTTRR